MQAITEATAAESGLTPSEVRAKTNHRAVVIPRQLAMMLMREVVGPDGKCRYSLPQIGRYFGGKHHTTVLASVIRAENICRNAELASILSRIRARLQAG